MRRSTDRILVSHAGTLPRPDDLAELMAAGPGSVEAFDRRVPSAVKEVVQTQAEIGIDILNDGEQGKRGGFSNYISERLSGITRREDDRAPHDVTGRDKRDFPKAFAAGIRLVSRPPDCAPTRHRSAPRRSSTWARIASNRTSTT